MEQLDPPRAVTWSENDGPATARWRSAESRPVPAEVVPVGDDLSADRAWRLAAAGTAMVWRGDYRNAVQVLHALRRRFDRQRVRPGALSSAALFHRHRQARARRARMLGMILVELDADYRVRLSHAPDVGPACRQVYGDPTARSLVSLRELLGVIGAHQWRLRGVPVPELGERMHPHYGVFAPTRRDYVALVAGTPLPSGVRTAFDVGTGTGVIAALLARAGVPRIVATDNAPRAVACARENIARLGMADRVGVVAADLFPRGRADLVVCNPPWVPGSPTSALEGGVFDPGAGVLHRFLRQLPDHLTATGEAWLVLSNLAELLELRAPGRLLELIGEAGLVVRERRTRPADTRRIGGPKRADPLASVRGQEVITLWLLAACGSTADGAPAEALSR